MKKHLSELHDWARGCLFGTLAAIGLFLLVLGVVSRSDSSGGVAGEVPTVGPIVTVPTDVVLAPVATVPRTVPPPNAVETEAPLATANARSASTSIAEATAAAKAQTPVREVNYGTWMYEVFTWGGTRVQITDIGSDGLGAVDGLKGYIEANKALMGNLATGANRDTLETVTVYFDYASPEQVNAWATSAGGKWQVRAFELHVFDPTGKNMFPSWFESWLHVYSTSGSVVLPPERVEEELKQKQQQVPGVQLEGVYSAEVSIERRWLPDLADSSLSLLVEVTPLVVRDDLEAAGLDEYARAPFYATGLLRAPAEDLKRLRTKP